MLSSCAHCQVSRFIFLCSITLARCHAPRQVAPGTQRRSYFNTSKVLCLGLSSRSITSIKLLNVSLGQIAYDGKICRTCTFRTRIKVDFLISGQSDGRSAIVMTFYPVSALIQATMQHQHLLWDPASSHFRPFSFFA